MLYTFLVAISNKMLLPMCILHILFFSLILYLKCVYYNVMLDGNGKGTRGYGSSLTVQLFYDVVSLNVITIQVQKNINSQLK